MGLAAVLPPRSPQDLCALLRCVNDCLHLRPPEGSFSCYAPLCRACTCVNCTAGDRGGCLFVEGVMPVASLTRSGAKPVMLMPMPGIKMVRRDQLVLCACRLPRPALMPCCTALCRCVVQLMPSWEFLVNGIIVNGRMIKPCLIPPLCRGVVRTGQFSVTGPMMPMLTLLEEIAGELLRVRWRGFHTTTPVAGALRYLLCATVGPTCSACDVREPRQAARRDLHCHGHADHHEKGGLRHVRCVVGGQRASPRRGFACLHPADDDAPHVSCHAT